jgi:hypothetical protein
MTNKSLWSVPDIQMCDFQVYFVDSLLIRTASLSNWPVQEGTRASDRFLRIVKHDFFIANWIMIYL